MRLEHSDPQLPSLFFLAEHLNHACSPSIPTTLIYCITEQKSNRSTPGRRRHEHNGVAIKYNMLTTLEILDAGEGFTPFAIEICVTNLVHHTYIPPDDVLTSHGAVVNQTAIDSPVACSAIQWATHM